MFLSRRKTMSKCSCGVFFVVNFRHNRNNNFIICNYLTYISLFDVRSWKNTAFCPSCTKALIDANHESYHINTKPQSHPIRNTKISLFHFHTSTLTLFCFHSWPWLISSYRRIIRADQKGSSAPSSAYCSAQPPQPQPESHTHKQLLDSTDFKQLFCSIWTLIEVIAVSLTYAEEVKRKMLHEAQEPVLGGGKDEWKTHPWLEAADWELLHNYLDGNQNPRRGSQIISGLWQGDFQHPWITDLITQQRMQLSSSHFLNAKGFMKQQLLQH